MSDLSEDHTKSRRDKERRSAEGTIGLPDASIYSFAPPGAKPAAASRTEAASPAAPRLARNPVFESLVGSETDLTGIIAYGLYKQNKRDWFIAFEREHARAPTEGEIRSYIVGESTERRLATYRRLAEDMLAESPAVPPRTRSTLALRPAASSAGAESPAVLPPGNRAGAPSPADPRRRRGSPLASIALFVLLILMVAAMAWILRSGVLPLGLGHW